MTQSYTVGNYSNRILLVATAGRSGTYATGGVTYNSSPMTKIARQVISPDVVAEIWYIMNPTVGTYNIVANFNNTGDDEVLAAASYYNVASITEGGQNAKATVTTSSVTNTNTTGQDIIDFIGLQTGSITPTANAGQTVRQSGSDTNMGYGFGDVLSPSANETMSWNFTSNYYSEVCVILTPVAHSSYLSASVAGFVDATNNGTTHPFTSGDKIDYNVQSGNALAAGTYYWRVEATDPTGTNTYGSWSSIYSFTVNVYPTANSFQRKTWYDGTRYWESMANGTQIQFWYSTNSGGSWTQNTSATITLPTNDYSIDADSTNAFIVYTTGYNTAGMKATSYPGTSFAWAAASTVFAGTDSLDQYDYPVVVRDSSGYSWVEATYTGNGVYYMKVMKHTGATNTLPSSSGDTVYSISSTSNTNSNVFGTLVPTSSQNMYATYVVNTALSGCKWVNGSTAWQNTAASSCTNGANVDSIATLTAGISDNMSSVADASGNVHLVYVDSSGHTDYQEYTSSWQTAVTLDSNSGNGYVTLSYDTTSGRVYAFWIRSSTAYYNYAASPYTSGSWQGAATSWHTGTTLSYLSSNYSAAGVVFAEWTSNTATTNWDVIAVPENLWFFFSLGIIVPIFSQRRRKKNFAMIKDRCCMISTIDNNMISRH